MSDYPAVQDLRKHMGLWIAAEKGNIVFTAKTFKGLVKKMHQADNTNRREFLVFKNHGKFIV